MSHIEEEQLNESTTKAENICMQSPHGHADRGKISRKCYNHKGSIEYDISANESASLTYEVSGDVDDLCTESRKASTIVNAFMIRDKNSVKEKTKYNSEPTVNCSSSAELRISVIKEETENKDLDSSDEDLLPLNLCQVDIKHGKKKVAASDANIGKQVDESESNAKSEQNIVPLEFCQVSLEDKEHSPISAESDDQEWSEQSYFADIDGKGKGNSENVARKENSIKDSGGKDAAVHGSFNGVPHHDTLFERLVEVSRGDFIGRLQLPGNVNLTCEHCGRLFSTKNVLDRHRLSHTGEKPFSCGECNKSFARKDSLVKHKRIHAAKGYACKVCGKSFTENSRCRKHQERHSLAKLFTCQLCGNSFKLESTYIVHMKLHAGDARPYACDQCDRVYCHRTTLILHKRTHEPGDVGKKAPCSICGKSFYRKADLIKHIRIHTGEKPFSCKECGVAFAQKGTLGLHMRKHTGVKPFACKDCGKTFAMRSTLVKHSRIHTGEKPYECSMCDKKFTEKVQCQRHIMYHTKEWPFTCEVCGKNFADGRSYERHKRVHVDKDFVCDACGKTFQRKSNLTVHVKACNKIVS